MAMCSICHEEIGADGHALPCGHMFHARCIVPWIWKQPSCPNCRYTERTAEDATEDGAASTLADVIVHLRQHENISNLSLIHI